MQTDADTHQQTPGQQAGGRGQSASRRELAYAIALRLISFGPGVLLFALVVTMAILSPYFLTERNLQNLGTQSAIVAMLALGQLLVIVTRGIDISVGAVVAFSAIVGVSIVGSTGGGAEMIAVMLLAGGLVGAVNGFLIAKGGLAQPLIVTVAMLGIVNGLALVVSGGESVVGLPPIFHTIGSSFVSVVPVAVLLVAAFAVAFWGFTRRTVWGRWIYAIGGNPEGAKRLGVPVAAVIFSVYVISGVMAGVAGIINAGQTDSATPLTGVGLELDAITAVIIGGASLAGGRGSVAGVLTGALILGGIRNGLDLLHVEPFYQDVAVGVTILLALELDVLRRYLETRLRILRSQH